MKIDRGRVHPNCLVHLVTETMKGEPALEAVKVDWARRLISVATLGKPHRPDLEQALTTEILRLGEASLGQHCDLLDGKTDCAACPVILPPSVRQKITIRRDGETTTIARVTCPTAPRFWRWRDIPWPKLVPREIMLPGDAEHDLEWKHQFLAAGLCGLFGLMAYVAGDGRIALPFYVLSFSTGAWFAVHEVWERLQKRMLDVHFLMLAVAFGSASVGAWAEGATLLFLFSLSGALEHYAMGRTQREIRSLFKTAPKVATVLDTQGHEELLPVEQLRPGMKLLIKPGEQFPVDAEVIKGHTASDESNLTGEAVSVEKGIGDQVLAGTLNLWGVVEAAVLRPASQSALQRIIALIKEAQHLKAPSQRFTDKFGTAYTYGILGLSLAMFFVWWVALDLPPYVSTAESKSAFYRAMTLLVVASPCALVLSIPSAILAAIAWSARRGILFRGGAAVEKLAEVSVVAMDKTGTLTTGELRVERVDSFPSGRESEVAQLAYSLERLSTHPLARAITRYGKQQGLAVLELEHFESVAGLGLQARHQNMAVALGRRDWFGQSPLVEAIAKVPPTEAGFSEVWLMKAPCSSWTCSPAMNPPPAPPRRGTSFAAPVADSPPGPGRGEGVGSWEGVLLGRILLRDDIRPQAREVVRQLRLLNLQTLVLTGDRSATADRLKDALGLDDVRAELKPEQKVEVIYSFTQQGRKVAMIGDGVNDAPSLAASHVGVAMGARGSDAALEQAEVVLMHDRLENFLTALQLSQRARRIIRQNLVISLGTVAVLVSLALFGGIPLTLGVVGHEGSTVLVVMNSLRLLFGKS